MRNNEKIPWGTVERSDVFTLSLDFNYNAFMRGAVFWEYKVMDNKDNVSGQSGSENNLGISITLDYNHWRAAR